MQFVTAFSNVDLHSVKSDNNYYDYADFFLRNFVQTLKLGKAHYVVDMQLQQQHEIVQQEHRERHLNQTQHNFRHFSDTHRSKDHNNFDRPLSSYLLLIRTRIKAIQLSISVTRCTIISLTTVRKKF